jgi:hypothetical protein
MLAACDVCGVEYVEGYEGPCQEYESGLTCEQFARAAAEGRKPRQCPGRVGLADTLRGRVERAEAQLAEAREALKREHALLLAERDESNPGSLAFQLAEAGGRIRELLLGGPPA